MGFKSWKNKNDQLDRSDDLAQEAEHEVKKTWLKFKALRYWKKWQIWTIFSTLDFWSGKPEKNEIDEFMRDVKLPPKTAQLLGKQPKKSKTSQFFAKLAKTWKKITPADEFMEGANLESHATEPGLRRHYLLFGCLMFIVIAVIWASLAKINIVTKGMGKIIPAGKIQVVQHLEGGIVDKILVREGDHVSKGQILMEIDDVNYSSLYSEGLLKYATLQASIARLDAEANDKSYELPKEFDQRYKVYAESEYQAYLNDIGSIDSKLQTLKQQIYQRQSELQGLQERLHKNEASYKLIQEELKMTRDLYNEGAAAKVEVLRIERQASDAAGDLAELKANEKRAQDAVSEAQNKLDELRDEFRSQAAKELVEAKAKLAEQEQTNITLQDRARRTILRSPVTGIVNVLHVNTVGGTVKPGEELVDIVPTGDNLLVEAKVLPSDIAFVYPGQKATVKITAYDYTIYGGLDGKVEFISADSITDKDGKSYYLVTVRTDKDYLGKADKPMSIIPGMMAEVDILTGERTVLTYILKPLLRASQSAWREK
jgi:adhesin transport system membrane fusion protein